MQIEIPRSPNTGCPPFKTNGLKRTTVFLGANGAGKSKLLKAISNFFFENGMQEELIKFKPTPLVQEVILAAPKMQEQAKRQYATQRAQSGSRDANIGEVQYSVVLDLLHARDGEKRDTALEELMAHQDDPEKPVPVVPKLEVQIVLDTFMKFSKFNLNAIRILGESNASHRRIQPPIV
jgi:hypothetical protein